MDQVCNNMLNVVQAMAERQAAKQPAQTQEKKDSFQNQIKQAAGQSSETETKVEAAAPDQAQENQVQEGQTVTAEDPKELERRMALAAMAAMQNPVVPVETDVPQETPDFSNSGLIPVEYAGFTVILPRGLSLEDLESRDWTPGESGLPQWAEDIKKAGGEVSFTRMTEEQKEMFQRTDLESGNVIQRGTGAEQESDLQDTPEEGMPEAPVFQDVREIPVKVGEAPAAAETREIPVEDQITPKLTEALRAGDTRVEIQLAPENLGKVTVEVTLHEDGALHVVLHAENSQTRGLLERSADNLMAMLGREARQEVQVEVPRQQESQQQNFYDGRQGHEHQSRQQQQQRQERQGGEDFLHQLRLGLVPGDGE